MSQLIRHSERLSMIPSPSIHKHVKTRGSAVVADAVEVKQGMLVTVDAGFGVDLGSCDDILTAMAAISEHEAVDATLTPEGCEFNYFTQAYEFMLGASAEDVDALMKMVSSGHDSQTTHTWH